jgi:hypothetical protein
MREIRSIHFVLVALLGAGCGESSGAGAVASASASGTTPAKPSAAVAQKGCPEGTSEVKAAGFCVKAPKDAKIEQESDDEAKTVFLVSSASDKNADGRRINVYKAACSEQGFEFLWDAKKEIRDKGDLEGGKGKFVWSANKDGSSTVLAMLDTPAGKCVTVESAASSGTDDVQKNVLAFGKTLSLPQ